MPEKKKILIFIDWFLPGYKAGGPIQSVVNLINHLGHEYDFDVVTSNKDLGEIRRIQISFLINGSKGKSTG